MSEKHVVIVAGGSGARMGSEIPKQFLLLNGKPIIVLSIEQFLLYDPKINIIVVLPELHLEKWRIIKEIFFNNTQVVTVIGGAERTASVLNGLHAIKTKSDQALVAIHDAVRPLVSISVINSAYQSASKTGSGVVAVPLKDSIREVSESNNIARNREKYMLVQTPQTFLVKEIVAAYKMRSELQLFTDDASVYEGNGKNISLVTGDYSNIKITTPEDLIIAEALLNKKTSN